MKTKKLRMYLLEIPIIYMSVLLGLLLPILFGKLVDDIILTDQFDKLGEWLLITFSIAVLSCFLQFYFSNYTTLKIGIKNTITMQIDAMQNILKLNNPIFESKDKGYYFNLLMSSCGAYGDLHEEMYLKLVVHVMTTTTILIYISYINLWLGILMLGYGLILCFISFFGSKPLYQLQNNALEKQDHNLNNMRNIVEHKKEINAIKSESYFNNLFSISEHKYEKYILNYKFWDYFVLYIPSAMNIIYNIIFLFVGAKLVYRNSITTGTLLMGYQYLSYISSPISEGCSIISRYISNKQHIERVDLLKDQSEMPNPVTTIDRKENILFETGDFTFRKGPLQDDYLFHIQDISLDKNKLYLIKGENGCGKTMFLNLLRGNIDHKFSDGTFLLGSNIEENSLLTYPIFTVDGSLEDNLFGRKVDEALYEILNIDFRYQQITTNPLNLSYGQQQKLALLRIFSMDEPILFLDEPLSNLDQVTQQKLIQYLVSLKGKKTMLIVMHSSELDAYSDGILFIGDQRMKLIA